MIVDLASLEGTSSKFAFSIRADEVDLDGENLRLSSDVAVSGEITKHLVQTDISGVINATANIDCTRCLTPVEKNLAIDFEVTYLAADEFGDSGNVELEAGDLNADALTSDTLDLREVVREQILLNLPTQVFCQDDCKGLCKKCGSNRNLIDCKCKENEIDPRWSALKNLE